MKTNKLSLKLYIYTGALTRVLNIISSLIILIPICIVLITNIPFSSSYTKLSLSIAFILILLGKTFSIIKSKFENKNITIDVSILIGLLAAFISYIFD